MDGQLILSSPEARRPAAVARAVRPEQHTRRGDARSSSSSQFARLSDAAAAFESLSRRRTLGWARPSRVTSRDDISRTQLVRARPNSTRHDGLRRPSVEVTCWGAASVLTTQSHTRGVSICAHTAGAAVHRESLARRSRAVRARARSPMGLHAGIKN
eukprot:5713755-Prymnesium_polylepis.1